MKVTTRMATPEDSLAIARVQVDTWKSAYRGMIPDGYLDGLSYEPAERRWLERLQSPASSERIFVSTFAEEVVGFVSCGAERTGDRSYPGEVYAIYVLPNRQKKGAGRALMRSAALHLKQAGFGSVMLWVLRENPSRGFYERLGGNWLRERVVEMGGKKLVEVAYGWGDVCSLL
jgi:ribosomal protein S18 acetylase RimI-like enzyme